MRITVLLLLLFLTGCGGPRGQLASEISANSEDARLRARNILSENPEVANKKGEGGKTPLHEACDATNLEMVNELIDRYKADVNAVDDKGNTPLHYAFSPSAAFYDMPSASPTAGGGKLSESQKGYSKVELQKRQLARLQAREDILRTLLGKPGIKNKVKNKDGKTYDQMPVPPAAPPL